MTHTGSTGTGTSTLRRLLPLAIIVLCVIGFFATGLHNRLSFDAIALRYGELTGLIAAQPVLSSLAALLIYAAATALSFPAAWLLSVTMGLVFGWIWGGILITFGATLGACLLFLAARYALAGFFRRRAGAALNRMAEGFRENATSYMLFLRLAPVFPFTLVNVVPAILGVPFATFAWTTLVGIIPGVIAYAYAGEGLRSIVGERAEACMAGTLPCGTPLTAGDLVTPQVLTALALLGIASLIPVVLKRLRAARR